MTEIPFWLVVPAVYVYIAPLSVTALTSLDVQERFLSDLKYIDDSS